MELNGQHDVDVKISEVPHANSRVSISAVLQKLTLKLETARNNIEDWYLHFQIPERIRKHLTFYRLHFIYFLLISIWGTIILYLAHRSDAGERRFTFVDSIFNVASVATVTGLSSVRVVDLSKFDQVLFLVLMTLGSPAFTSLIPLCVRRFYFYRHHRMHVKQHMKEMIISSNSPKLETPIRSVTSANPGHQEENGRVWRNWDATSTFATAPQFSNKALFVTSPGYSMGNVGRETHQPTVDIVKAFDRPQLRINELDHGNENHHVHSSSGVLKCSQETCPSSPFDNVMRTIEHKGLVVLTWMVPVYIIVTQLAGIGLNLIFFSFSKYSLNLLRERNLNTFFFCLFTVFAAFTNSGIPANDDNLVPFQRENVLLLLYTSISLMGNLLYPAFLRLIISVFYHLASESRKPVYGYLLNHPRRCFTHLFPHKQTVWLGITVIGFTVFQLIFFCALDWNEEALKGLTPVDKVVDGIYQSVSARTAGGDVVNIAQLATGMLVLFVFMMFIASYPVTLLRQNSTVYEHTEIGIYDKQWEEELTDNSILFQSRKLFATDSCYLCLILLIICLIENKNIENDPLNYSVFNIIFEIVRQV
ncbi:unnamed protein product [Calypogeia fissa]